MRVSFCILWNIFFNTLTDNVSEVLMICSAKQDENYFEPKMLRVLPVSLHSGRLGLRGRLWKLGHPIGGARLVCCQDTLWKFSFGGLCVSTWKETEP